MDSVDDFIKSMKVMIVDDHDPIRKAMRSLLNKMGCSNTVECFDGHSAINEFEQQPDIDLILCDIYMKKVDGFEVLKKVRNRSIRHDIPFIIVTGEATKNEIVKASDLGADDYLLKPFQPDQMTAKITSVVDKFLNPSPLIKRLRLGDRLMLSKDYEDAINAYQEALVIEPSSKRAKHSIAVALDQSGKETEALELLEQNIKTSGAYYRNYATLANIYVRNKQYELAIDALRHELDRNPKQPDRQIILAKILMKLENPNDAILHFREALKENPKSDQGLLGIGQAFVKIHNIQKGVYYFKRHRRHYPTNSKSLIAIVKYCLQAGEARLAEIALRDEKKMHSERHDAYIYLAKLYMQTDEHDKATQTLEGLLSIEPHQADALKMKASTQIKEQNYEESLEIIAKISKHDMDAKTYHCKAECLQRLKRMKESEQVLHRALALNNKDIMTLFMLGNAYYATKQFTKAYTMYRLAKKHGLEPTKYSEKLAICQRYITQRRSITPKKSA